MSHSPLSLTCRGFADGTPVPGDQKVCGRLSSTTDSNGALAENQGDVVNSPTVAVSGSST